MHFGDSGESGIESASGGDIAKRIRKCHLDQGSQPGLRPPLHFFSMT
jgi:hypothetical protein